MKKSLAFVTAICCIGISHCQEITEKEYELKAEIVDDSGNRVPGATVRGARSELRNDSPVPLATNVSVEITSNTDGIASLKLKSVSTPGGVAIYKKGFYSSFYPVTWKPVGGLRSEASLNAVLKPLKKPIAMRATFYANTRIMIPAFDTHYGYDLEASSFTAPHGHGKHEDIVFRVEGKNDGQGKGKMTLTIRTGGEKSGFLTFSTPDRKRGSELISDYLAPDDGYSDSMVFHFNSEDMVAAMNQPQDGNLYFRVRTKLNPDGSIKSCHYGKIYGPFTFWAIPTDRGGVATFGMNTSYFNPTPNDRNVEFDPKRNLNPNGNVQKP